MNNTKNYRLGDVGLHEIINGKVEFYDRTETIDFSKLKKIEVKGKSFVIRTGEATGHSHKLLLERENVEDIANHFGLKVVPIIGEGALLEAVEKTRQGFKNLWGDFIAEGIVLRPKTELKNRRGERIITKIKYRDFN